MIWIRLALLSLCALTALWLLALGVASWRQAQAERAYPPQGQMVMVEGRAVHAVVFGDGPVDLVLIHGSSGSTRDFTLSFTDLLPDRYRVIVLDRPGLGWSDPLPREAETIHDQARVLRLAAQSLGAERPIVLGQSYGAAVALAWAVDAPQDLAAVVNVSGPTHPWAGGLPGFYRVTAHPVGAWLAVPVIAAAYTQAQVDSNLADVFAPQPTPQGYDQGFGVALAMTPARLRANARHRAGLRDEMIKLGRGYYDLAVPVEIIHGAADRVVGVTLHGARMIHDTDQARLTTLDGIGHMPHHVAAPDVVQAIDRAAARAGLIPATHD